MSQGRLDIDRPPDLHMQIAELERERQMRQRVYPRWVEAGKLSQEEADRRNKCLDAAIESLDRQYRVAPES